jgi:hypothetical protein
LSALLELRLEYSPAMGNRDPGVDLRAQEGRQ